MTVTMRKLFGLESASSYVLSTMTDTNLGIVRYEGLFFSIISGFVLLTTLLPIPPWTDKPAHVLMLYRVGFFVVLVTGIVSSAVVHRVQQLKTHSFIAPLIMLLFIVAIMGLSMWLSLFDFAANRSLLIYVGALVLLFGVIYLPPIVTLFVTLICTIIMMLALASKGFASFALSATLFVYAFLAVAVSSTGYHARLRAAIANERILNISVRDELTGVKNRRALDADAKLFIGCQTFILLGDIDEFKFYNDSFGHAAGDGMLKRFAQCMTQAFGEEYVYRYGGDEFVAAMREVSEERFLAAVDSWRKSLASFFGECDGRIGLTPQFAGNLQHLEASGIRKHQIHADAPVVVTVVGSGVVEELRGACPGNVGKFVVELLEQALHIIFDYTSSQNGKERVGMGMECNVVPYGRNSLKRLIDGVGPVVHLLHEVPFAKAVGSVCLSLTHSL